MPELPEVEIVVRELRPVFDGARIERVITRRRDLRIALPRDFSVRLQGQTVKALRRRAKYLVAELSSGDVLLMHLGMTGSFRIQRSTHSDRNRRFSRELSGIAAHDHVIFHMSSGAAVVFNDPRRFGFMKLIASGAVDRDPTLRVLGPEPLEGDFDGAVLARALKGRKTSLKAALSDQRIVAGLGNIYVCEALHRAQLSPRRRGSTLAFTSGAPRQRAHDLAAAIREVLTAAIDGSPSRRSRRRPREPAYREERFRVYDREGERCLTPGCTGSIRRIVQVGRSTFFCPVCQR